MLFTDCSLDQIGYEVSHGAQKLGITARQLKSLLARFDLPLYRVGSKTFIASTDLVRLQYILIGEAAHQRALEKERRV